MTDRKHRILEMIGAKPVELCEAQLRALINRPDASAPAAAYCLPCAHMSTMERPCAVTAALSSWLESCD